MLIPQIVRGHRSSDKRGWFVEAWSRETFSFLTGLNIEWLQDSLFFSEEGALRGPHFYPRELDQFKLTRCISGRIQVVAINVEGDAPFGSVMATLLSGDQNDAFLAPPGWAHGVMALLPSIVMYKTNVCHAPNAQKAVAWDDPAVRSIWLKPPTILSEERRFRLSELRND